MKARDFDVVDVPPDFADLFRIDAQGRKLFNLFIGGKWRPSASNEYMEVRSPSTRSVLGLVAKVMWEETFGPVLPVHRVESVDEAIRIANRSHLGLDSAVFTSSLYSMWQVTMSLEVGTVSVNDAPAHGVGNFPFGGIKGSGIGREGLGYSIDELTVLKTVSVNLEPVKSRRAR